MKALLTTTIVLFAGLSACTTAPTPSSESRRDLMAGEVERTITLLQELDPGMKNFFESSVAYAVFPNVGKGGFGIGGAYGRGILFEDGTMVGYCDIAQGTIGFQAGGQAFREVIFFESEAALDRFKGGEFSLSAQASAVAVEAGASTTTDYSNGVAVFTLTRAGLMFEASVGGQTFNYAPLR